jgi:purine-binding chemotaxis protein CheW
MANETYVLFDLAGAQYALRSRDVQHIEMLEHVTPVPNTADAVEGVVFSRGQVIPAMNLRVRFGFAREPHTLRTRMIVAQTQKRTIALIVDAAREFRPIPDEAIRPIEETLTGVDGNYLRGVATVNDRLVLLLNLEAVLNAVPANVAASPAAPVQNHPSHRARELAPHSESSHA